MRLGVVFFTLLAAACGTTTSTTTPDAGTIKEPKRHRPAASACDATRPPTSPEPSASGCKTDDECKGDGGAKNPRCVFDLVGGGQNRCSVDECATDGDCGQSRVCACRLETSFGANRCFNSECRTDGDCGVAGKGFCSPSGDNVFSNCPLKESGSLGYFCHRPEDECTDDADCGGINVFCLFSPAKGHFACAALSCTK